MPYLSVYHRTWVSLTVDLGLFLHGCYGKAQLLLLTLDEWYLLTAAPPDLEGGVAPPDPPAPAQQPLLGGRVAPLGRGP